MHWIPFWQWNSWTPEERGQVATYYESLNQRWAIDLTDDKPPNNPRLDDCEEYEGEARDRGLDGNGYIYPRPAESNVGKKS